MNPREGSAKAEINAWVDRLKKDADFWGNVSSGGCTSCQNYAVRGCALANGVEPPPHVKAAGCPSWAWDGVPF
jgi:hypothetical protein